MHEVRVRSSRYAAARALALATLLAAGPLAQAQTYQPPSVFVSGTNGNGGQGTYRYATGTNITVTISSTSTTTGGIYSYGVRTANSNMGAIGGPSNAFLTGATTTSPAALMDLWGWGCPIPGLTDPVNGTVCLGRGTVTFTFSEPVTDPYIQLGGMGTNYDNFPDSVRLNAQYTLTGAANGASPVSATLTRISGNTVLNVAGSLIGSSTPASEMSTSCSAPATGSTGAFPAAACGTVRVNGTVTSVSFDVSIRGYGTNNTVTNTGYPQSQNTVYSDGHLLSASIAPRVDLGITKTNTPASGPNDLSGDTYQAGETRTYTIVVTNNGQNTVVGATVADILPAVFSGASWTASYSAGGSGPVSGTGNLNATITLPSGGTATFLLTATVSPTATGDLSNTATVTMPAGVPDTNPANNSATDTDRQLTANLTITKTNTPASGPTDLANDTVVSGQNTTYTLLVTNAGPDAVTGAVITDQAVSGLTCPGAGNPDIVTCSGPACTGAAPLTITALSSSGVTLGTLPSGQSTTLTLTCRVN